MKKLSYLFMVMMILSNVFISSAFAAISQEEVDQVLAEKGMTMEQLQEMLDYYEWTLEDFETTADLSDFIGTPVTPENLQELLTSYEMTQEELEILLGEFGETVEDYYSIEELDASIDFYLNHESEMQAYEDSLAEIGLTEEEVDKLFQYFESLDQLKLEEQMEQIGARLEGMMTMDPDAELTEEQIQEALAVWNDMIAILGLDPKFYLVDANGNKTPVTYEELTAMQEFTSEALIIELYTTAGELLLDMQMSKEMLNEEFALEAGEELTDIGDMAGELTKLKHDQMPNTASPYLMNALLGLSVVLIGVVLLAIRNRKQQLVK